MRHISVRHRSFFILLICGVLSGYVPVISAQTKLETTNDSKKSSKKPASIGVTVNGVAIDAGKFNVLFQERLRQGQLDSPALRENVLNDLIQRELLVQEAKKKGIDKLPIVKAQVELASESLIGNAYLSQWLAEHPIAEEEVRKEYDAYILRMGSEEVHIRQILVGSFDEAKGIAARIAAGEKFEDLAMKLSRDMNSRGSGGLIPWTPIGGLPEPIADIVKKMPKGQLAAEPIKTNFGFHVIRLEDKRGFVPPTYEQIKLQVLQGLQQRAIDQRSKFLVSKAQIKG